MSMILPRGFPGINQAILAIGDSWFWYPNNNLVDAVLRLRELKEDFRSGLVLGKNGAKLSAYREGEFASEWRFELKRSNFAYSVVMISGGGNDVVDLGLALKKNCANITDPKKCFNEEKLNTAIDAMVGTISALISDVQIAAKRAEIRTPAILLNGYDLPVPDGTPFSLIGGTAFKFGGPWLKPALDAAKVEDNRDFRIAVVAHFMETFNTALQHLANQMTGVFLVRQIGTLSTAKATYKSDWANEMHPTRAGFDKLARGAWLQVLQQIGVAQP